MRNRSLILITVLFGLLLVGIIIIQFRWAGQIAKMNQKAFDDAVYKSLSAVVKQVEEKENFVFIKKQVETDTLLRQTKKLLKQHSSGHRKLRTQVSEIPGDVHVSISSDNGKETKTVIKIEKNAKGEKYVYNSVYVGSASVDSGGRPAVIITPPTPPTPPIIETIEGLDDKKESVEIIMEKMLSLRDPDSVSIDPKEIEKMIATQLKQNDLPDKFHFALLAKDPKKSFVGEVPDLNILWRPYKVNLYPNDIFGREITLTLMLPIENTIIKSGGLSGPMVLSLFFTLAILALFIYSIRMLIRHKKMLEMKTDFINHMSHEFKTPLAGISLGADILLTKTEQLPVEQVQKIAATIKKQSQRLGNEINDVLQNAVLEEKIAASHTLFNLVDVAKTQIELFQPQIELKKALIIPDFGSDKILINGNENQWHKIFSNLLDNSLKFSTENPEIKISVRATGKNVKIEVIDNGVGIAAKDLPHIFEKFFRSDYYKKSNIQGFGLGLSFVAGAVKAHGGTINAESELNHGTKIIIEINAEG